MDLDTNALIVAVLPHGENGAVVRLLTPEHGLVAGYVRGGRSRRLRPVLQPGNAVALRLHSRSDSQLAAATVELTASRAGLAETALGAATLSWLTALTAAVLTEATPHPRLFYGLDGLLQMMQLGAAPPLWLGGVARYELLLLGELGFGLDLTSCAATGATTDLLYVSPKSSRAVSAAAGAPYADRLLPLPRLLVGPDPMPGWDDVVAALRTTGHFIERDLLTGALLRLRTARGQLTALAQAKRDGSTPH